PLFAVANLEMRHWAKLPGFRKRMQWFLDHRADLAQHISYMKSGDGDELRLLAIPSRDRLERVLRILLDERELLSPSGVRSLWRAHAERPYVLKLDGHEYRVGYDPAESTTELFGGNSNWRGPVWMPGNFLLIEALERYYHFYGDQLRVECPTG